MSRRLALVFAWCGFVVLVFLHVDAWRQQRDLLYLGWIPEELLYRLGWILLAWLYLLFLCARVWRSEERP